MARELPRRAWPGEDDALWSVPKPGRNLEFRPDIERNELIRSGVYVDHSPGRRERARIKEFVMRPWEPLQRWKGMMFVGDAQSGRSWQLKTLQGEESLVRYGQTLAVARMPARPTDTNLWAAIYGGRLTAKRAADIRSYAVARLHEGVLIVEDADVPRGPSLA